MAPRYIPNDFEALFTLGDTQSYLIGVLADIVKHYPPCDSYPAESRVDGFWGGPTGIAYLLLHVSAAFPDLEIHGHRAITWAEKYMSGSRPPLDLDHGDCGLHSERLCLQAVRACMTKDLADVEEFLDDIPAVLGHGFPDEMLFGRAGTLYLLRMVRHWVPESAELVGPVAEQVSEKILAGAPNWTWRGSSYLGAIHGDIGIVTQLVLTTPSLADRLESKLDWLLSLQCADGNWVPREGSSEKDLIQFCHGGAGFVISLVSLRVFFPRLHDKIDSAIRKGRECIWREGLLRKEPNLCHGIFGNALALPRGPGREHFLAIASPEKVVEMRRQDLSLFEPADYGRKYALMTSYHPSAVWAWLVCGQDSPGIIAYNDV